MDDVLIVGLICTINTMEQKVTQWLKRGMIGFLLLCTFACTVQIIAFFFPYTYLGRDRLNDVAGEVEVVLSSRRGAEFATLSPDKRWMAVNVAPSDRNMNRIFPGDLLIDLETETAYLFPPARGGLSTWMDSEHVLFNAGIVRVTDFMHWGLETQRGPFDSMKSFPLNLVSCLQTSCSLIRKSQICS